MLFGHVGRRDLEIGSEDVGAVEIRRSPGVVQLVGIVSREEKPDVALFVEGVAPGVACAGLEVVREALLDVGFQRVIC